MKLQKAAAASAAALLTASLSVAAAPGAYAEEDSGIDLGSSPLANGAPITMVNNGRVVGTCTATVTSTQYVLTAGHCASKGLTVRYNGKDVGTVTASGMRNGYDIAKITLKPGVEVQTAPAMPAYAPRLGDTVTKLGMNSGFSTGTVTDPSLRSVTSRESVSRPLDGPEVRVGVWTAKLMSVSGDSGGPVMVDGQVVGLVKGGADAYTTTVTPLGPGLASLR